MSACPACCKLRIWERASSVTTCQAEIGSQIECMQSRHDAETSQLKQMTQDLHTTSAALTARLVVMHKDLTKSVVDVEGKLHAEIEALQSTHTHTSEELVQLMRSVESATKASLAESQRGLQASVDELTDQLAEVGTTQAAQHTQMSEVLAAMQKMDAGTTFRRQGGPPSPLSPS